MAANNEPSREKEIFEHALDILSAGERADFLNVACGGNVELRQRVEGLLRAHEGAGGFLPDDPAPSRASGGEALTEQPGDRIGRYKLLEKIGEGGCGVVYMAEQEEPVRRKVALKIIKLGLETRSVIARFEAERQALAMMDHPNIAKILDGGVTESRAGVPPASAASAANDEASRDCGMPGRRDAHPTFGRPYFVMELVRGVRITDYCEQHNLSTRQRLDLFIAVCSAIQHAHQKGIIHRDIKPSNVLVTENDPAGAGCPKVIDFGIAKATEQKLTDKTLFTQFAAFIGTPAYMSPEQAALTSVDIDTRADIYSLGVLLYELLTGTTPFDAQELLKAGFDEMRRVIRETDPERPSTRLTTRKQVRKGESEQVSKTDAVPVPPSPPAVGGEGRGEEGALSVRTASLPNPLPARSSRSEGEDLRRAGQAKALNSQLQPLSTDLDWIVMKCLEKDRTRRYETANGLAADLQRHLNNEPVVARPPSRLYQFEKTVQRNKLAFAATAGIAVALLTGAIVSTWQAMRARKATAAALAAKQEANATAIAERAAREEASAVSKFLTQMFESAKPSREGREVTVVEILDRAVQQIETNLTAHPARQTKLRETLGFTYQALGHYRQAIPLHEKALEYYRATFGPGHSATLNSMNGLAISYHKSSRVEEAIRLQEAAVEVSRKVKGGDSRLTLMLVNTLANFYDDQRREADALKMREELLALHRKVSGPNRRSTLLAMHNLAASYSDAGRRDEAIALEEEVLAGRRELLGPKHPETLDAMGNLAFYYSESHAKHRKEAFQMRQEVLEISRKVNGPDHPDTRLAIINMIAGYHTEERCAESEALAIELLTQVRKIATNNPSRLERGLSDLADLRACQKQFASAEALYREALESRRSRLAPDHDDVVKVTASLGRLLADWTWAERANQSAIGNPQSAMVDRSREAERLLRESLEQCLKRTNATPWRTGEWQTRLGAALISVAVTDPDLSPTTRGAKLAEAERLLLSGHEAVHQSSGSERGRRRVTLERLVRLYEAWDKPTQAAEWRAKLEAWKKADAEVPQ